MYDKIQNDKYQLSRISIILDITYAVFPLSIQRRKLFQMMELAALDLSTSRISVSSLDDMYKSVLILMMTIPLDSSIYVCGIFAQSIMKYFNLKCCPTYCTCHIAAVSFVHGNMSHADKDA